MNPIIFPEFNLQLDIEPVAFSLFGRPVYWYGLIIAAGFLLGIIYAMLRYKKEGIDQNKVVDFLIIVTPISIIGARAYYVIFNIEAYSNFSDIFKIWEGGLAIYGAIIASFLTTFIYCRIRKIPTLRFLDVASISLMIGQCIGRWGNFINREAYGTMTSLPWRMEIYSTFYGRREAVHPTFLYESLWNLLGIVLLHFYSKKKKFNGEIFLMYIGWYGLGRAFIEGLRTDSLYIGISGIRVSQVVAALSVLISVILILICRRRLSAPLAPDVYRESFEAEQWLLEQTLKSKIKSKNAEKSNESSALSGGLSELSTTPEEKSPEEISSESVADIQAENSENDMPEGKNEQ